MSMATKKHGGTMFASSWWALFVALVSWCACNCEAIAMARRQSMETEQQYNMPKPHSSPFHELVYPKKKLEAPRPKTKNPNNKQALRQPSRENQQQETRELPQVADPSDFSLFRDYNHLREVPTLNKPTILQKQKQSVSSKQRRKGQKLQKRPGKYWFGGGGWKPNPTYKATYKPTPYPTKDDGGIPSFPGIAPAPGLTKAPVSRPPETTPAPFPGGPPSPPGPGATPAPTPLSDGSGPTPSQTPAPSMGPGPTPTQTPAPSMEPGGPEPTPPTVAQCQSRDRTEVLQEAITQGTGLTEAQLDDNNSPQGQAFLWIDGFDSAMDPCTYPTVVQRFVVATFWYSTGGQSWNTSTGWLSELPECNWYQIECVGESPLVTGIVLEQNNLDGSLPEELSSIASLRTLYLNNNTLVGNFPSRFSNMSLEEIDVEGNLMSGNPLSILTGIRSLTVLRISSNDFTGTLPPAIGNWDIMREFWLAENSFSGPLPSELGNMVNLQTLFMYDNQFEGPLPTELGNLRMFALQAHQNRLNGNIPEELYNNVDLTFLRLDVNSLTGSLSGSFGRLSNLRDLRLANNSFVGALPPSFYGLVQLRNVVLRHNQFTGPLRDSFASWDQLEFLDVSHNNFDGLLPPSLFEVPTLRIAYLHVNSFQGSLPATYSVPPLLRDLYVNDNQLRGPIPAIQANQLQELTELLVHNNMFTGVMPASVCALRTNGQLDDLFADCNPPTSPEIVCACCNQCYPLPEQ